MLTIDAVVRILKVFQKWKNTPCTICLQVKFAT